MTDLPDLLQLTDLGDGRYQVFQPSESAEGRDVVFSGQYLAQILMASELAAGGSKVPRSIHAIFARAGTYTKPIELSVESIQAGRTWASDSVTAAQDGRLLCRATVLLTTVDPDLMRHDPVMPDGVPDPESVAPGELQMFPGAEMRPIEGEFTHDGAPVTMAWHRYEGPLVSPAGAQAVLAWATCGQVIGVAMRPHRSTIRIEDAHSSISTGVIGHTVHFLDVLDVSDWLLIVTEGTKAALGRVYGGGSVYTADGRLVAAFHQDSMAKAMEGPVDPQRAL